MDIVDKVFLTIFIICVVFFSWGLTRAYYNEKLSEEFCAKTNQVPYNQYYIDGNTMNNLQTLSDKLHEYNQTHSTAWAILLCTPRTDEVFIVDEEDNKKSPSWWPNNSTGETIEKALELMPKKPTYSIKVDQNNFERKWINQEVSEEDADLILKILHNSWSTKS